MTENEAIELLRHHSGAHENLSQPKSERGFLGMLRPFEGQLYEENFHEVMEALTVLAPQFKSSLINKEVMSCLWSICHLARAWGLDADGMLRRNNLITDGQREQLTAWVNEISDTVMMLLDEQEDEIRF